MEVVHLKSKTAAYLKVAKRAVYRLVADKKIPAFKVGGTWRFSRAEIDTWIKQQSKEWLDAGREDVGSPRGNVQEP